VLHRFSFRFLSALGLLVCAGSMAFALYLQYGRHLEPCPMCIFQRVAMIATGLVFLVGLITGAERSFRFIIGGLAFLTSAAGAGIAARHVWLQSLPADQVPACGGTLDYMLQMLPLKSVVMMVLKGDGNCAKIVGQWLGITLPGWTLVAFVGLALYALCMPALTRRPWTF
jgi:disulfide bond formation protein DsbB